MLCYKQNVRFSSNNYIGKTLVCCLTLKQMKKLRINKYRIVSHLFKDLEDS